DPTAVQVGAHAGAVLGLATQFQHGSLQLLRRFGALPRTLREELLHIGSLDVFGADLEAGLAVLAGLDQLVEGAYQVFAIVCEIHKSPPGRLNGHCLVVCPLAGPTWIPTPRLR